MPLFRFKCSCGKEYKKIVPRDRLEVKCTCGKKAKRSLPSEAHSTVYDTASRYHGKKAKKGIAKQLKERSRVHHDRYELEEKIDKYGIDDAITHGWTKKIKKV